MRKKQEPNGERKAGVARLWEILDRDFGKLIICGLPALAAIILYGFSIWFGIIGASILITVIAGLLTGMLVGPAITAVIDAILRSFRDEPGPWWTANIRAWKQNMAQGCIVGGIMGALFSSQIFCFYFRQSPLVTCVSIVVLAAVFLYVFPQIAMMKLKTIDIFRNAILLALANPILTVGALLTVACWILALWLLLPASILVGIVGGVWFPALLILMQMNEYLKRMLLEV